jgi:hypothetical protein
VLDRGLKLIIEYTQIGFFYLSFDKIL